MRPQLTVRNALMRSWSATITIYHYDEILRGFPLGLLTLYHNGFHATTQNYTKSCSSTCTLNLTNILQRHHLDSLHHAV